MFAGILGMYASMYVGLVFLVILVVYTYKTPEHRVQTNDPIVMFT